jgi:hypothetical protein
MGKGEVVSGCDNIGIVVGIGEYVVIGCVS